MNDRPGIIERAFQIAKSAKVSNIKELRLQLAAEGTKCIVPLVNRIVPIVSSNLVRPDQGTGVIKVTPVLDRTDYLIAREHKLETISITDCYNNLLPEYKVIDDTFVGKITDQKFITRYQNGIYTRSTFINNLKQNDNNYLMCVYIVDEPQRNSHSLKSVGLACVDNSTGDVYIHSGFSDKFDEFIALDEAMRFIHRTTPSEILIYYDNQNKIKKNAIGPIITAGSFIVNPTAIGIK